MLTAFVDLGVMDDLAGLMVTSLEKYVVRLFCQSGNLNLKMEYVHKTAGLWQFATNEGTSYVWYGNCLICSFQSTVIQPQLDGKNWEMFWCPSWQMNLQLQKLLSKWDFVNAKQIVVPFDASVRRIPWFVQKCVYVLDAKTLLLTKIWSAQLYIMTMVKIMESKIKWATEQDKQVREYVWNSRYITNEN